MGGQVETQDAKVDYHPRLDRGLLELSRKRWRHGGLHGARMRSPMLSESSYRRENHDRRHDASRKWDVFRFDQHSERVERRV